MRRAIYYALLAALWTGGMALVIWCLYLPWEPLFGFLIMSGGSLAAVATVAAANTLTGVQPEFSGSVQNSCQGCCLTLRLRVNPPRRSLRSARITRGALRKKERRQGLHLHLPER